MTRTIKFEDFFWDEEFCGTQGYDILLRKLKDGRKMCQDWEHFIKERAKIEEEYATKLQKLVRSTGGGNEMGSLLDSWVEARTQTDQIANEHLNASKEMTKSAERIQELMQAQKQRRLGEEQRVTKSFKQKKDLYQKVLDNKKTFHSKSIEADNLEKQITEMKKGGIIQQMSSKDSEKLLTKSTKLKEESKKADSTYKDNLASLDRSRLQWEADMSHLCNEFETLEVERIMFLRNEIWVHTNILSQTAVDDDEHCEDIRISLERCDVDKDLTDFIENRKVGTVKPYKVEYGGWQNVQSTLKKKAFIFSDKIEYEGWQNVQSTLKKKAFIFSDKIEYEGWQNVQSTLKKSPGERPQQPLPWSKHGTYKMGAL